MEKEKKTKKSSIVLYFILGILLFLFAYVFTQVLVANINKRPPRVFGLSVSYVPTESMEPVIHKGDYVIFKSASFDDVQEQDIIVYYNPEGINPETKTKGIYIIHRVIKKYDTYLETKGDNNMSADSIDVTKDLVIGKYIGKADFLKTIFSNGINHYIIYTIIIILLVVFFTLQIISILIKMKKEKLIEEKEKEKNLLREQMKNEILKEELEKLKNNNKQ